MTAKIVCEKKRKEMFSLNTRVIKTGSKICWTFGNSQILHEKKALAELKGATTFLNYRENKQQ